MHKLQKKKRESRRNFPSLGRRKGQRRFAQIRYCSPPCSLKGATVISRPLDLFGSAKIWWGGQDALKGCNIRVSADSEFASFGRLAPSIPPPLNPFHFRGSLRDRRITNDCPLSSLFLRARFRRATPRPPDRDRSSLTRVCRCAAILVPPAAGGACATKPPLAEAFARAFVHAGRSVLRCGRASPRRAAPVRKRRRKNDEPPFCEKSAATAGRRPTFGAPTRRLFSAVRFPRVFSPRSRSPLPGVRRTFFRVFIRARRNRRVGMCLYFLNMCVCVGAPFFFFLLCDVAFVTRVDFCVHVLFFSSMLLRYARGDSLWLLFTFLCCLLLFLCSSIAVWLLLNI